MKVLCSRGCSVLSPLGESSDFPSSALVLASCSFSEVEASCHRELCHDGRQMMTSHRAPFLDSGDPKGARHDRAAQSFISNAPEQPESGLSLSFIGNKGCHCNQETGNCFTYKTCLISSGLDTTEQLLFIALFYTSFSRI